MNKITPELVEQFKTIVGLDYVFTDAESFEKYGKSWVSFLTGTSRLGTTRKQQWIYALFSIRSIFTITPDECI